MNIVVRAKSIQHRFGPRLPEWYVALLTSGWGLILMLPAASGIFDGQAWIGFLEIAPQFVWGLIFFCLGAVRIGGLFVNGARKDVTPWIRAISAIISLALWSGISFGFGYSGVITLGLVSAPLIAVLEFFNIFRSFHDVGEAKIATTNNPGP